MLKNSYQWISSDVNIIRCRKTDITEFCLMLISSDAEKTTTIQFYLFKFCLMVISSGAEKPELFKFLWCLDEQIQKNRYHRILADVNIIRCRKNRNYWILSDVNIIRCSKKRYHGIFSDCRQMQKSSYHWMSWDANIVRCRKKLSWNSHCLYRYRTTAINEYSLMLILSDAGNIRHLNFLWC